ncbi:YqfO family protein [Pseudomaricurvus sp. HS19]|uniref:Nif3-like dinuclear metal center hexameric protein n=1 Tax=Pseudomaricurvus sp. HS19 TaxID=2692626 RepID=UPI0013706E03|nr:YqfO family protein [Pseudomaricurvus sp. HS19]MYM61936.1 NGG1p interacting factor NIF3 [Pseudomaricurvus sp. HS19]
MTAKLYKLAFFVPESHLEVVKAAVFASGAGRIGDYDSCCWQVLGEGQFRPLPGSNPYIGAMGSVERVAEYKVEMVCAGNHIRGAVAALKLAHPYEEPAYDVWLLESGF